MGVLLWADTEYALHLLRTAEAKTRFRIGISKAQVIYYYGNSSWHLPLVKIRR